jgi:hypothetical protein
VFAIPRNDRIGQVWKIVPLQEVGVLGDQGKQETMRPAGLGGVWELSVGDQNLWYGGFT